MLTLMAVFIVLPQVQVVLVPGLDGYLAFFREGPNWLTATRNSIVVMLLGTSTAVLLGFLYAYAMVYSHMPWKSFFRLIAVLPMLSPPFVVAASYILLFGPRGLITYNVFGQSPNILGLFGLWGVQTIAFFPYASALIADQYTVLPTLAYGLISGFGDFAGAAVVSCILLSMALVLYFVRLRLEGGKGSFVTVTGRAASMPRPPVSARVSIASFAACLLL